MPPKTRAAAARKTNRRKVSKNIVAGQAHIKSTFNNTIVSITDPTGAVISWSSAGDMGFKVPVAKPQSVPCRLQASRSVRFRTLPPLHTTAAVLRSVAASN